MMQVYFLGSGLKGIEGAVRSVLTRFGTFEAHQFPSLEEAKSRLSSLENFEGWVICDLGPHGESAAFFEAFRPLNPGVRLVFWTPSLNETLTSAFLKADGDQVIVGSPTAESLVRRFEAVDRFRGRIFPTEKTNPSLAKFDLVTEELTDDLSRVRLIGTLTERVELPAMQPRDAKSVLVLDFEHLRVINSVGIKLWISWMQDLTNAGFKKIEMVNLKPGYLQLASFVGGFVPSVGVISSFYLHYWNNRADIMKYFKFHVDHGNQKLVLPKYQQVVEMGHEEVYEIDDSAALILRLFKDRVAIGS